MAQAQTGDKVKVHYEGTFEDGMVFDSSEGRDPLEFTLGENQVIPGFENGVVGMEPEEAKTVNIPVDEAYGPRREELVREIPRSQFPEDMNPEVGQQLQMRRPDGQAMMVIVADVAEENVTLDANHPLAGKNLAFNIKLVGAN